MEPKATVQNCKWAEPTLYQDGPYWLDAWNMPWTCRRDGDPRMLEETDVCQNCPRWEAREGRTVAWTFKEPVKSETVRALGRVPCTFAPFCSAGPPARDDRCALSGSPKERRE